MVVWAFFGFDRFSLDVMYLQTSFKTSFKVLLQAQTLFEMLERQANTLIVKIKQVE